MRPIRYVGLQVRPLAQGSEMCAASRAKRGCPSWRLLGLLGRPSWRLLGLFITVISVSLTQANIRERSDIGKGGTDVPNKMTATAINDSSNGSVMTTRNGTETFSERPFGDTYGREGNEAAHEEEIITVINNTDSISVKEAALEEKVSDDTVLLTTTTQTLPMTSEVNEHFDMNQNEDTNLEANQEIVLNQTKTDNSPGRKPNGVLSSEMGEHKGGEGGGENNKYTGILDTEPAVPVTSVETNTQQIRLDTSSQLRTTKNDSSMDSTSTPLPPTDTQLEENAPQRRSVEDHVIRSANTTSSQGNNFSRRVTFTEVDTFKDAPTRNTTQTLAVSRNVSSEYIFECPRYCSCFVLTSRLRCRGPWVPTADHINHTCTLSMPPCSTMLSQTNNSSTADKGKTKLPLNNGTVSPKKQRNHFLPFRMKELELQLFYVPVLNLSILMRAFEDHFFVKRTGHLKNGSTSATGNVTVLNTSPTKSPSHSPPHGNHHEVIHVVYNPNFPKKTVSIFIGEGRRLQYRKLEHVTDLTIRDCNLTRIARKTLGALPNLSRLDLSGNAITHIHQRSFLGVSNLIRLDLSKNSIKNISRTFVNLKSLEVLNLETNLLTSLDSNSFLGLSKITYLNLGHNLIASVDIAAFQHLRSLTTLVLSDNPLSSLVRLNFFGSKLQYIDMSNIKIDKVPQVITQSIRNLRVSGNNLRSIQRGDLDAYPYLGELDLEQNGLEVLEEDALGRHEYLTRLFMGNNQLMEVPQSLPISLAELYLQMNQISALRDGDFRGLSSLEQLFLFDNNISYVSDAALTDLTNLRTLNLRTNKIQTLGSNIFLKLSQLSSLDLSENPISSIGGGVFVGLQHLQVLHLTFIQTLEIAISVDAFSPLHDLEVLNLERSPSLCKQITNSTEILKSLSALREIYLVKCNMTRLSVDFRALLPRLREVKLTEEKNGTNTKMATLGTRARKGKKRSLADTNKRRINSRSYQGYGDRAGNDTTPGTAAGTGTRRAIAGLSITDGEVGSRPGGNGTDTRTKKTIGRGKPLRTWGLKEDKRIVDYEVTGNGYLGTTELKEITNDENRKEYVGKEEVLLNNAGVVKDSKVNVVTKERESDSEIENTTQNIALEMNVGYDHQGTENSVTISSRMSKRSDVAVRSKQDLNNERPVVQGSLDVEGFSKGGSYNDESDLPISENPSSDQPRESSEVSTSSFDDTKLHRNESKNGTENMTELPTQGYSAQDVFDVSPEPHSSSIITGTPTGMPVATSTGVTTESNPHYDTLVTDDTSRERLAAVSQTKVTDVPLPREVLDVPMNDDSEELSLDTELPMIGVDQLAKSPTTQSNNLRFPAPDGDSVLTGRRMVAEFSPRPYLPVPIVPITAFKKQLDWIQVKPTITTLEPMQYVHKVVRKQMHQPTGPHLRDQLRLDATKDRESISDTRTNPNHHFGESSSEEMNIIGRSELEEFSDSNNEKPDIEVIEQKATKNSRNYESNSQFNSQAKQLGNSQSTVLSRSAAMDSPGSNLPQLSTISENSSEVHINRDTYLFRGDSRFEIHNILKHAKKPDADSGGIVEEVDGHVHFNKIFDLFDHRKALSLGVTFVATVMVFVTFGAMFMFAIIRIKFGMNQIFTNRLYRGTTTVGERLSRSNSLNCESPYRENVQTRVGNRLALNGPGQNKGNKTSLPSSSKKFASSSSGKLFSGALMTAKMSRIKKSEEIRAALLDNVGLGEYEGGALTPPSPPQDDIPPVIMKTRSSFDDVALTCDDTCLDLDDRTLETCQDCNNLLVGNLHEESGIHVGYRDTPSRSSSGDGDLYQPESPPLSHHQYHHHSVLSEDPSFARIFNATEDPMDSGSRCVSDCSGIPDDYNFSNFPTTTSCSLSKNCRGGQMDEVYDNVVVLGSSPLEGRRHAQ